MHKDQTSSEKMLVLKPFIKSVHDNAKAKGFWKKSKNKAEKVMLIVTELAEAVEADRHGDMANFREELADAFIRICDLAGQMKIDLEKEALTKHAINLKRPYLHGKKY